MKNIDGKWSGRITGTNNANVFIEINQESTDLSGNQNSTHQIP